MINKVIIEKNVEKLPTPKPDWVVLSESKRICRYYIRAGIAAVLILSEDETEVEEEGIDILYAVECAEDADEGFLEKVWQRFHGQPWIIAKTSRCILRESVVEDVEAFYAIYKEPSITAYMENLFPSREEEVAYIQSYTETIYKFYGFGMWTIVLKETGEIIGRAGLDMRQSSGEEELFVDPELGFVIGTPWQGKGLAREVCEKILQLSRDVYEMPRVISIVKPENRRSILLLERLGMTKEKGISLQGEEYDLYKIEYETE